jgi:tryptophan synthase alpha chain
VSATVADAATNAKGAPTSRLQRVFARARAEHRKVLAVYLTASDPDLETSRRLMVAAAAAGADIIEIGIPWSDPSADGVVIQAAMHRARAAGGGLTQALEVCRGVRAANPDVALVPFGYANPIVIAGADRFAQRVRDAGGDAILCVDWPPDEGTELLGALGKAGVGYVPLLAPTSTPARVAVAAAAANGFIYYVSMTGITGAKISDLEAPRRHIEEIRGVTGDRHPIVVGFGVKTADDARAIASFADGVVVGSAAVRVVESAVAAKRDPVPELETFVRGLAAALKA